MTYKNSQIILADGHVHIYECFDLHNLLNSAWRNFKDSACQKERDFSAILFLTETKNENYFQKLAQWRTKKWTIKETKENCSLYAVSDKDSGIFLIAGHQIVTAEDIEVLALITTQKFEDGAPLELVIKDVISSGGIPVIPWGFGKWIGRRGRIINELLEEENLPILFLGDNSGRPTFWPEPYNFKLAKRRGLRILPGSDPLPFPSEYWRPGSFGFSIEGYLNPEKPGESIKQILLDPTVQTQPYGSLEKPFKFIRNQIAMQILKQQKIKK